jgi:competence protein ComEC
MIFIVSIVIGIFSISLVSVLPDTDVFCFFVLISLVLTYGSYISVKFCIKDKANYIIYYQISQWVLWLVFSFLVGISYGYISASSIINKQLPIDLDNKMFIVDGLVSGLVKNSSTSIRFDLIINRLFLADENNHLSVLDVHKYKKIRLSYYRHNKKFIDNKNAVNTGDNWQFLVKLKRPRGFVNPAGFDYQGYLLSEDIAATGYVKKSDRNIKYNNKCIDPPFSLFIVACVRAKLNKFLMINFNDSKVLGMLTGLMIGEKSRITKAQWQTLKDTGTIHLLAISGLHIGLAATIGYWLGKFFQRCLQIIMYRLYGHLNTKGFLGSGRWLASIISMLFALAYSLLAGLSLPTQRALIMLSVLHIGLLFSRNIRPWGLFVIALLGVALTNSLAIYSQGFWLSFLAVATLIVVFNGYLKVEHFINKDTPTHIFYYLFLSCISSIKFFFKSFLKAQGSLVIGLLLPSIILLKGLSGLGFIANFIAIPLVTIITVPLLLLGILLMPVAMSAATSAIDLANSSIEILLIILQLMQKYGVNFWGLSIGDSNFLVVVTAIVGTFYLLLPKGVPYRWLGVVCLLPVFFSEQNAPLLKLTVFDVGQGIAVIVETPDFELVYDTGKKYSDSFNIGEHILAPYLKSIKKQSVDKLMISHNDLDHAGGVGGLLKKIKINTIHVGELDASAPLNAQQCLAGQKWWWNNVSFTVVWPTLEYIKVKNKKSVHANEIETRALIKSNNLSCVLLIRYQSIAILLAGDIEKKVERQLINNKLIPKNITLLLVPHHGSQTSSHQAWVNYLDAKYVVFSAGFKNSYGHPHQTVVARYKANNARLFNTATDGAVQLIIDVDHKLSIHRSRVVERHYWHDAIGP